MSKNKNNKINEQKDELSLNGAMFPFLKKIFLKGIQE